MIRIIFVILLCLTSLLLYSEDISFLLRSDLTVDPYFYESNNRFKSFGLLNDLYIGASLHFLHLITAFNLQINYYSFDGHDPGLEINGSFFNIKGLLYGEMALNDLFSLGLGCGGTYLKTAFSKDDLGFISLNHWGLSLKLNLFIDIPVSFLSMELRNEFDVFDIFSGTSPLFPYYMGGVRINVIPHKYDISYFLHVSCMLYHYKDIEIDLNTSMLVWGAGISIHLPFYNTNLPMDDEIEDEYIEDYKEEDIEQNEDNDNTNIDVSDTEIPDETDTIETDNTILNSQEEKDPLIESLSQMKKQETLSFPVSTFIESISELDENSIEALDKIIGFLKENPEYAFNITGYSYFLGDPLLEIQQSMKRANIIKDYFISYGVETERITINSKAILIKENKDEERPYLLLTRIQ